MANEKHIEPEQLEQFHPFSKLSDAERKTLASNIAIKTLPAGKLIFKQGEQDSHAIYLLSGEISLSNNGHVEQTIRAHTPHANAPIASQQPRQFSARAETEITIFWLDSKLIERMSQSEKIDYQVDDIDSGIGDDWMVNMLQSPVFHEIPAANIQQVMVRFQQVPVKKGDVLIQQGDEGDFYYFLQEGECSVVRTDEKLNKDVQLAVLKSGDTFGEEALVSGRKRSTTVKMITDGVVFKLSKEDFIDLIKNPVLRFVTYKDAKAMVAQGAKWMDVRPPEAFEKDGLDDSINIPNYALRFQINKLEQGQQYIAYCDDGQKSSAAAFLAQERGYQIAVLTGGLAKVPGRDKEKSTPTSSDEESSPKIAGSTILDASEKYEQENRQLQLQLEQLSSKNLDLEQELKSKAEELEQEATETRKQHEQEYYSWQKERDLFKKELDTVKRKFELLKASEAKAQTAITEFQAKADQQESSVQERIQALTDHIAALEKEVEEAKDSERHTSEAVEGDQSLLRKEIERLEEKLQAFQHLETDEMLKARADQLEQDKAELVAEQSKLAQQLAAEKTANEENEQKLQAQVRKSEEQNEASTALSLQLQAVQLAMQTAESNWSEQQSEAADQLQNTKQSLADAEQQLQAEQATSQQQHDDIESLKKQLAELTDSSNEASNHHQTELDELSSALADEKQARAEQQQLYDELTQQRQSLTETQQSLTEEVGRLTQDNNALETQLSEQKEQQQQTEEKLEQLQNKLSDEASEHTLAVTEQDSKMASLESELSTVQEQLTQSQEALTQAEESIASLADITVDNDQLKQEMSTLTADITDLKTNLALAEENEANSTSLATEKENLEQQVEALNSQLENKHDIETALEATSEQMSALEVEKQQLKDALTAADLAFESQSEELSAIQAEHEAMQKQLSNVDDTKVEVGSHEKIIAALENRLNEEISVAEKANEALKAAEEQKALVETGFAEMKSTLNQLIQENQQLKQENKALSESASENESERLFDELRQEKNELNEKLLMTMGDLQQAQSELSVRHHETGELIAPELKDDQLKDMIEDIVPDELNAIQAELKAVRELSAAELKEVMKQRNEWEEKYHEVKLKSEKYEEEYNAQDQLKGTLNEDKQQLEHSIHKLRDEYKKLKANSEEQEGILQLEREENNILRTEKNALEQSLLDIQQVKEKLEVSNMEEQHRIDTLESELSAKKSVIGRSVSVDQLGKRKNSRMFYLFAGILFGLIFVNLVLIWEGNPNIYARLTTVAKGLFPDPDVNADGDKLNAPSPIEVKQSKDVSVEEVEKDGVKVPTVEKPTEKVAETTVDKTPVEEVKPTKTTLPTKPFKDKLRGMKSPEFVAIPGGEFVMGNRLRDRNQSPERTVTIADFAMMTHEVTFAEYAQFARATGRKLPNDQGWGKGKRPVINVSLKEAKAYAKWLSKKGPYQYRLPSEAEWEYAAGAKTNSKFWWGYDVGKGNANCFDCDTTVQSKTVEVGQYPANPFQLHDVAGNVFEWVADCYHDNYQGAPVDGAAWEADKDCRSRIVRGGSFRNLSSQMSTTYRRDVRNDEKADDIGFRLVRSIK